MHHVPYFKIEAMTFFWAKEMEFLGTKKKQTVVGKMRFKKKIFGNSPKLSNVTIVTRGFIMEKTLVFRGHFFITSGCFFLSKYDEPYIVDTFLVCVGM